MYLNFDVKRFEKYSFSYGTSQMMTTAVHLVKSLACGRIYKIRTPFGEIENESWTKMFLWEEGYKNLTIHMEYFNYN